MWHYHTWDKYSKLLSWRWWKGFVYLRLAFKTKNCRCHRPVNVWRETSTSRFYDKENNSFSYCCFYTLSHILFFFLPFWSPFLWPRSTCWGWAHPSTQTSSSWGEMQDLSGSIPPTDRCISSLLSCSPPIGWCLVWLRPCHPLNAKPLICHAPVIRKRPCESLYLSFHACACGGGIQNLSIVQLRSKVNLCFYRQTLFDFKCRVAGSFFFSYWCCEMMRVTNRTTERKKMIISIW